MKPDLWLRLVLAAASAGLFLSASVAFSWAGEHFLSWLTILLCGLFGGYFCGAIDEGCK